MASVFHHFDMVPLTNHIHPLCEVILGGYQQISDTKLAVKWPCLLVHEIICHHRSFVLDLGRNLSGKSGHEDSRYETIKRWPLRQLTGVLGALMATNQPLKVAHKLSMRRHSHRSRCRAHGCHWHEEQQNLCDLEFWKDTRSRVCDPVKHVAPHFEM